MTHRTWSLIASLALLAGCAPGDPGLVIMNVVAPDDTCLYDIGNNALPIGLFDVTDPNNSYEATLRYGNQLINLGNNGTTGFPMADPNPIAVQEIEVEILGTDGAALGLGLPNPFTVPSGGGVIPSSDGTTFGEGLGRVTLIPPVYTAALAGSVGDIIVSIRAVGTTLGGAEVVSNEFTFPITLTGDLTICQMDEEMVPVCSAACDPGQDGVDVRPAYCATMTDLPCQPGG